MGASEKAKMPDTALGGLGADGPKAVTLPAHGRHRAAGGEAATSPPKPGWRYGKNPANGTVRLWARSLKIAR